MLVEDGDLVFKADVMAKTEQAIYLEGIYVAPAIAAAWSAHNVYERSHQTF